jgi:hypothetical protein
MQLIFAILPFFVNAYVATACTVTNVYQVQTNITPATSIVNSVSSGDPVGMSTYTCSLPPIPTRPGLNKTISVQPRQPIPEQPFPSNPHIASIAVRQTDSEQLPTGICGFDLANGHTLNAQCTLGFGVVNSFVPLEKCITNSCGDLSVSTSTPVAFIYYEC